MNTIVLAVISSPDFYACAQLLLALALGLILGTERTFAGRTAGMRTYGLVAMGSCLLVVTSNSVLNAFAGNGHFDLDPLRLAEGIVTGIGFLGAGIIIFREGELKISGLTTAAGLWVSSGIGMAVGFGLYNIAIFATILTMLAFTVLWNFENKIKKITEKPHDTVM